MAESTVLLAALGIVATCVGALSWVIRYMFKNIMPVLEKINTSTVKNTQATVANTKATKANEDYLKQRNERDSKLWIEVRDSLKVIATTVQEGK